MTDELMTSDPGFIAEPPETKWPTVLGAISIVYAVAGMLFASCGVAGTFLGEYFARLGGMEIVIPTSLKVVNAFSAMAGFALGFLLIAGGTALLRRRRAAIKRLKTWAVLRIVLIVVGTGIGFAFLPANLEIQRSMMEMQNEALREADRADLVQVWDEEKMWNRSILITGVMVVVVSAYPVFLGFYLSRPKITEETQLW